MLSTIYVFLREKHEIKKYAIQCEFIQANRIHHKYPNIFETGIHSLETIFFFLSNILDGVRMVL